MAASAPDGEPIGDRVRRLRIERGFTQAALATKADCSRSLVQQIENGTRVPPAPLRERLSSALGQELPMPGAAAEVGDAPGSGHYDLRMRFNILLGRDPGVVERALAIAQSILTAREAPEDVSPLRTIAARQLERAEEILTQIPSRSATVWEWNTINDWLTVLETAQKSVRGIHTADLGTIGGDVGNDYQEAISRLADSIHEPKVTVRRMYVLDRIEDVWPYDDKLWRQARTGVESVLVKRAHARNAQSMLIVDDRYVCIGEYDYSRQDRVATRFSVLKHDVAFAIRRFDRLYDLRRSGSAIVVNELVEREPLTHYDNLAEGESRTLFRELLERAWNEMPAPGEAGRS
jgi:transcriptional regulator with XRE-family HTH domain